MGEINGQVEETYSGQTIIKIYNHERQVEESFGATNAKLYNSAWKAQFLSGLMMPIMSFVSNLGYVSVTIAGAMLAVAGQIMVGDIQAFTAYVRNFTRPISQFAQMSSQMQAMAAATERVFSFLDEAEEEQGDDRQPGAEQQHHQGGRHGCAQA